MRELKHDHIVRYHDRIIRKAEQKLYIVMEYCNAGDLATSILEAKRNYGGCSEDVIHTIALQLAQALSYCHTGVFSGGQRAVLHRDLKPQNVFLTVSPDDNTLRAKLGDFGLSRHLDQGDFAQTCVGTPYYWSPELLKDGVRAYNHKSDMWSFGCILYEMATGSTPFSHAQSLAELKEAVKRGPYFSFRNKVSKTLVNLITKLLHPDPQQRPSAQQILGEYEVPSEVRRGKRREDEEDEQRRQCRQRPFEGGGRVASTATSVSAVSAPSTVSPSFANTVVSSSAVTVTGTRGVRYESTAMVTKLTCAATDRFSYPGGTRHQSRPPLYRFSAPPLPPSCNPTTCSNSPSVGWCISSRPPAFLPYTTPSSSPSSIPFFVADTRTPASLNRMARVTCTTQTPSSSTCVPPRDPLVPHPSSVFPVSSPRILTAPCRVPCRASSPAPQDQFLYGVPSQRPEAPQRGQSAGSSALLPHCVHSETSASPYTRHRSSSPFCSTYSLLASATNTPHSTPPRRAPQRNHGTVSSTTNTSAPAETIPPSIVKRHPPYRGGGRGGGDMYRKKKNSGYGDVYLSNT